MLALAFLCVLLLLSLAGVAVVAGRAWGKRKANAQFKLQIASMQARWEALAASTLGGSAAAGTMPGLREGGASQLVESFTLGWANLLIGALWVPVLEKHVSSVAAERLQLVLSDVLRKAGSKKPWRWLEAIRVEEVTFGLVPPRFQFCTAKYDPGTRVLALGMDMHYVSSGMQAVLTLRVRQLGLLQPFSVRLEVTHLSLEGRLNLALQLTHEPPGIKGLHYSFASEPRLDLRAAPVGATSLAASELPSLLVSALRTHLTKVINRRIVEPNRRWIDLQKIYRNKHIAKAGGPGGLLRVVVVAARDLLPAPPGEAGSAQADAGTSAAGGGHGPTGASAAAAGPDGSTGAAGSAGQGPGGGAAAAGHRASAGAGAAAGAAGDIDAYVEMRWGREVFRTPICHHNPTSPVWNWQFDVRLAQELPQQAQAQSNAQAQGQQGGASTAAAAGPAGLGEPGAATATGGAPPLQQQQQGTAQTMPLQLHFAVLNALTVGEPERISTCSVDVASLGLSPNGEPLPLILALKPVGLANHQQQQGQGQHNRHNRQQQHHQPPPHASAEQGTLHVHVSWQKAVPKRNAFAELDAVTAATAAVPPATATATATGNPVTAQVVPQGQAHPQQPPLAGAARAQPPQPLSTATPFANAALVVPGLARALNVAPPPTGGAPLASGPAAAAAAAAAGGPAGAGLAGWQLGVQQAQQGNMGRPSRITYDEGEEYGHEDEGGGGGQQQLGQAGPGGAARGGAEAGAGGGVAAATAGGGGEAPKEKVPWSSRLGLRLRRHKRAVSEVGDLSAQGLLRSQQEEGQGPQQPAATGWGLGSRRRATADVVRVHPVTPPKAATATAATAAAPALPAPATGSLAAPTAGAPVTAGGTAVAAGGGPAKGRFQFGRFGPKPGAVEHTWDVTVRAGPSHAPPPALQPASASANSSAQAAAAATAPSAATAPGSAAGLPVVLEAGAGAGAGGQVGATGQPSPGAGPSPKSEDRRQPDQGRESSRGRAAAGAEAAPASATDADAAEERERIEGVVADAAAGVRQAQGQGQGSGPGPGHGHRHGHAASSSQSHSHGNSQGRSAGLLPTVESSNSIFRGQSSVYDAEGSTVEGSSMGGASGRVGSHVPGPSTDGWGSVGQLTPFGSEGLGPAEGSQHAQPAHPLGRARNALTTASSHSLASAGGGIATERIAEEGAPGQPNTAQLAAAAAAGAAAGREPQSRASYNGATSAASGTARTAAAAAAAAAAAGASTSSQNRQHQGTIATAGPVGSSSHSRAASDGAAMGQHSQVGSSGSMIAAAAAAAPLHGSRHWRNPSEQSVSSAPPAHLLQPHSAGSAQHGMPGGGGGGGGSAVQPHHHHQTWGGAGSPQLPGLVTAPSYTTTGGSSTSQAESAAHMRTNSEGPTLSTKPGATAAPSAAAATASSSQHHLDQQQQQQEQVGPQGQGPPATPQSQAQGSSQGLTLQPSGRNISISSLSSLFSAFVSHGGVASSGGARSQQQQPPTPPHQQLSEPAQGAAAHVGLHGGVHASALQHRHASSAPTGTLAGVERGSTEAGAGRELTLQPTATGTASSAAAPSSAVTSPRHSQQYTDHHPTAGQLSLALPSTYSSTPALHAAAMASALAGGVTSPGALTTPSSPQRAAGSSTGWPLWGTSPGQGNTSAGAPAASAWAASVSTGASASAGAAASTSAATTAGLGSILGGGGGAGGPGGYSPLQSLAAVVRIQRLLDAERAAAAELRAALGEAQGRCEALQRLRRAENRRALVEGARFCVFSAAASAPLMAVEVRYCEGDRALRLAACDPREGAALAAAAAALGAAPCTAAGAPAGGAGDTAGWRLPVAQITRVDTGAALFPPADAWGGLKALLKLGRAAHHKSVQDSKCLTLVLAAPGAAAGGSGHGGAQGPQQEGQGSARGEGGGPAGGAAAAGEGAGGGSAMPLGSGGRGLHLQVPPGGNGRSRDEWATAFADLAPNLRVHSTSSHA